MCFTDKFFFCVPLDWGCLLLGCITFILGSVLEGCSIALLVMEQSEPGRGLAYLEGFPELVLNTASANILLSTMVMLAALWMLFSVLLLLGIKNNKSGYLLWYFSYGTLMTILCVLSALLVLIQDHWVVALVKIIASLIYIHCLSTVHTTYDLMLTTTMFKFAARQSSDETILVESTEEI